MISLIFFKIFESGRAFVNASNSVSVPPVCSISFLIISVMFQVVMVYIYLFSTFLFPLWRSTITVLGFSMSRCVGGSDGGVEIPMFNELLSEAVLTKGLLKSIYFFTLLRMF